MVCLWLRLCRDSIGSPAFSDDVSYKKPAAMKLVLGTSPALRISLNPVRTEDQIPSVAFDLLVEVAMPFQGARITSNERWFSYEALNAFEAQLSNLRDMELGSATLQDMSERPVVDIAREGNEITMAVRIADTTQSVTTVVEVRGCAPEVATLYEQLASFPKWW